MPEGPSIVILKEAVQPFVGNMILEAESSVKGIDVEAICGKNVTAFKSWGKHFLICLPDFTIRIHLMLFGTYLINSRKALPARLSLRFRNGEINFYACSVSRIDAPLDKIYDWSEDVMNSAWNPQKAIEKLKQHPQMMVCDALLDQHIFSGAGNIIKNEALFRTGIHPESLLGKIPPKRLEKLVKETVHYSHQFYKWRKASVLKEHFLVYGKRTCPGDNTPIIRQKLGKTRRSSFYCPAFQKLYN
jgi:endonuclease-8